MSGERILVTGGTGFIGSFVAKELISLGKEVILLDLFVRYFSPLEEHFPYYNRYLEKRFEAIRGKVTLVRGDTRHKGEMRRLIHEHRPDRIIHLAALPIATLSDSFPHEAIDSIVHGTVNLLEVIREVNFVQRFVYVSSSMVYGDFQYEPADEEHPKAPKGVYGGAKLCGEVLTQAYGNRFGVEYTIVRPSAVYGPTDVNRRVSQIFVENALSGKPLILHGGGGSCLDFTYVDDAAHGLVLATLSEAGRNEVFNITRGEGRSLKEFANILKRLIPRVAIVKGPHDNLRPRRGALDISRARRLLGYAPRYSLEDGIEAYVAFVQGMRIFDAERG